MKAQKLPAVPEPIIEACPAEVARGCAYQSAFRVASAGDGRSAEQWARIMYEAPPRAERLFVWYGWKALTARLGPFPDPDFVLGYRIQESRADLIRFSVEWKLGLRCDLVLFLDDSGATLASFVRTPTRAARVVWPAVVPIHEVLVPRWLARAGSAA